MVKNGPFLCSKQTKRIKNLHYMVNDTVEEGDIIIWYCPTVYTWADIHIKALQGRLFYKIRALLMGIDKHGNEKKREDKYSPRPATTRITGLGKSVEIDFLQATKKTQAAVADPILKEWQE